jgi:hypothetical protein
MPPDQLEPPDHQYCRAEDDPERRTRQFGPRWYAGKSGMDGLELLFDKGEFGARLVGSPHIQDLGHAGMLSKAG